MSKLQGGVDCSQTWLECYRLHNNGILAVTGCDFGNMASTRAIYFYFDPDASYSGTTMGPGKAIGLYMYPDGTVRSRGTLRENTYACSGIGPIGPVPNRDPPWFSWN